MVCGMFVCVSLSINVCMCTVSNALLMSSATAMLRVGGMGWLKHLEGIMTSIKCRSSNFRYHVIVRHCIKCYSDVNNAVECPVRNLLLSLTG